MKEKICVGLFGTSGQSTWRKAFIEKYTEAGIEYFNPQVAEWTPACAEAEALHLAEDGIVLYPILGETFGIGSLAESGFAAAQTLRHGLRHGKTRHILFFIEPKVIAALREKSPAQADESERARYLVRSHLDKLNLPNMHPCQSLAEMLALSLELARQLQSE